VILQDEHQHRGFQDLETLLQPGDLLIFNDTQVIPARLLGRKVNSELAQPVEVFLLEPRQPLTWLALPLVKQPFEDLLEQLGEVPLPPYIQDSEAQPEQYQTVYAQHPGAVAAPTAGLHFTSELLARLQSQDINQARLTLHVGIGTFRPVETDNILQHNMHSEWMDLPATTVDAIKATKANGGRVIAVGTTVTRALEGACQHGPLTAWQGRTNLFIYPGYQWRVVDGLITNFHLPKSSLLMLVSALVGRERLLSLYADAIAHQYRFYSFGDAMLILPEAVIADRAPDSIF